MNKLFIILGFLSLCLMSHAQENASESPDLIVLNNGTKFIGEIIEYDINSHIVIQTSISKPIRLPIESVKKVIQDYQLFLDKHEEFDNTRTYYHVDAGTPITSDGSYGFELGFSVIKQLNQHFGLGGGVSYVKYSFYEYSDERTERLPIYLSFRSYPKNSSNTTPFFQFNGGYAINIHDDNYKAGWFANPKVGLRFGSSGLMYNFYAGVHLTKSDSDKVESPWGSSYEQIRTIRRTTIGLGIMF